MDTYYGPKTIEECEEQIALYTKRIQKRPSSAKRYQAHIDEAVEAKRRLEAGAVFDTVTQSLK